MKIKLPNQENSAILQKAKVRRSKQMNTATAKSNFIKCDANLYSWLLNIIDTPYEKHSLSCCEEYLREQSLLLG